VGVEQQNEMSRVKWHFYFGGQNFLAKWWRAWVVVVWRKFEWVEEKKRRWVKGGEKIKILSGKYPMHQDRKISHKRYNHTAAKIYVDLLVPSISQPMMCIRLFIDSSPKLTEDKTLNDFDDFESSRQLAAFAGLNF